LRNTCHYYNVRSPPFMTRFRKHMTAHPRCREDTLIMRLAGSACAHSDVVSAFVALCMWLVAAMLPPAIAAQPGAVLGQVVEARSGEPVAGAEVRVARLVVETDEVGMFRFDDIAAGRYDLQVSRIGYADRTVAVTVLPGDTSRIRLLVSEAAIVLAPLTVEALSPDSLRARGAGYGRSGVSRAQLAQWQGTNMKLGDVLRSQVPGVRVRTVDQVAGSDVCVELRSTRSTGRCLSPAVYLNGVAITNPTMLLASLDIREIERIDVVPAAEAGVRYGPGALYGALLIETRRPGGARPADAASSRRTVNYDWTMDEGQHATLQVFASSAVANSAGVALGLAVAGGCLRVRAPAHDAIVSDCGLLPTLGSAVVALAVPALGSGLASRWAGQTAASRGDFAPAAAAAAMVVLPGYAVVLSGMRNDSDALQWIGRAVIVVGAPAATTAADYLFRHLRR
jgi:hypothetical protein